MKQILVTSDLSPHSDRAVARAFALAQQHETRLRVLYVVDNTLPPTLAERLKQQSTEMLEQQVRVLNATGKVSFDIKVPIGRPVPDIVEEAETCNADVIVVGVHRDAGARDLFVGSTAWRVLRETRRPVLMVKTRVLAPYRKVLAAFGDRDDVDDVLRLAGLLSPDAEISAVHAFHVPFAGFTADPDFRRSVRNEEQKWTEEAVRQVLAAMKAKAPQHAVTIHTAVREGEVCGVIWRECEKLAPDLVVLGTHARTGLAHWFHGSVAEEILRAPPADVLAVRT